MNSSVKVSIIIPVRNEAKHLAACLDSVVKQTLQEIEIIVVEGGSEDNSKEIICRYMDMDSRIKLLNKDGEGLSLARQAGLNAAVGKYIYHLDGDDILVPKAMELLYNKAEDSDADMVVLNFWIENECDGTKRESSSIRFVRFSGIDFIRTLYTRQNYWMIWSVFHKRSLYQNFDIRFEAKLFFGEDTLLTTQLAYYSRKVVKLNHEPVLHHFLRKGLQEKRLSFSEKQYFDLHTYPELVRQFLRDKPEYDQLQESIDCLRLQSIMRCFQYHCFESAKDKSREALTILNRYPHLKSLSETKMTRVFQAFSFSERLGKLVGRMLL